MEAANSGGREVVLEGSLGSDLPVVRDPETGMGLQGAFRPVRLTAEDLAALPPCPGPDVVQPALVPGPPMIRPDTSEEDRVRLCLRAYGIVCKRQLPGVWNPYDRNAELKPADRKALVTAAEALCRHSVSPLRWVEFSLDQWRHAQQAATAEAAEGGKGRKRKAAVRPPLRLVFSVTRIDLYGGWCRNERERRSLRVSWTRSLRTLMARWQQMRAAVFRGEMTPAEACAKFFPGDVWARQLERAREDARKEQQRINTEIERGEYLW